MSINFPSSLDSFTTKNWLDPRIWHASNHNDIQSILAALETKVGIDNSSVATSFDYRIRWVENSLDKLYAGPVTTPVLTDNGNGTGTVNTIVAHIFDNPDGIGIPLVYTITGGTFTFTDGTEEYVVVDYNGGSPIMRKETDKTLINDYSIFFILVVWRQGTVLHSRDEDSYALALPNKINASIVSTTPYRRSVDGGLVIGETITPNPRTITCSEGIVFAGIVPEIVNPFNSSTDKMTECRNTNGVFSYIDRLVYDNANINPVTGVVAMNNNKYSCRYFFRSIGDAKQLFYIMGNFEYNSITAAKNDKVPNIPVLLRDHCMLVGRTIIQQGVTSGITESAFDTTFSGSSVINHNDTLNIQGGYTGNYFHNPTDLQALTKEPTGFDVPENVIVTGNSTNRTVTLTGTFNTYWRGILNTTIVTGYVSPSHGTDTAQKYYLSYDGNTISWSTSVWTFDKLQIAIARYDSVAATWVYIRECHGLMSWQSHQEDHETIGTYKQSGGTLSSFILNSTTAANRRLDISQTVVKDEDLSTVDAALTSKLYTQFRLGTAGADVFTVDSADIVSLSTNNPYYNTFSTPNWSQTLMPANSVATIWIYAIPVASDATSQKYRFLFVQPQWVTQSVNSSASNLLAALNIELTRQSSELNLGGLNVQENICIGRVAITFTGSNWTLSNVSTVNGTRLSQVSAPAGNYLSAVTTDTTLTGNGTSATPLGINLATANTWGGVQTFTLAPIVSSLTASQILASDANKNIVSLPVATYPSLTELSYVKGVTSAIQTQINGKEPTITAGTTAQYWRGDKSWQTLNTTAVTEGTNLYYTDARARLALSSTATGLTYTNTTGVFSLTSGYVIPTTTEQTNWGTAYTHAGTITGAIHGSTTVGANMFRLTNPSAITFPRFNADNTVSALDAATFRTAIGNGTWATVNYPTWSSGTPFVKMTAAGTFALDTTTYLTGNQSITLSGAVTGSGATSIATTLATNIVGASNMKGASSTQLANGTSGNLLKSLGDGTFAWDATVYYPNSNPSGYTSNLGTVTSVAALTLGTTGTDLSSTVATGTTTPVITLNVPTASATNRGALSAADWNTFNNKVGQIIDITYENLVSAISGSTLIKGQYYRITDFNSIYINNASELSTNVSPAPTEPLICLAIANNKIAEQVWSETYPKDIIYYDYSLTYLDGTNTAKGFITYRKDTERNVELWYDWRNIKFKRWVYNPSGGTPMPTWTTATSYIKGNYVQNTGVVYLCLFNHTSGTFATDLTAGYWVSVFNTTQQKTHTSGANFGYGSTDVSTYHYTFSYYDGSVLPNAAVQDVSMGRKYFNGSSVYNRYSAILNNTIFIHTSNTAITGVSIYDVIIEGFNGDNTISTGINRTHIMPMFSSNTISTNFQGNFIGISFNNNFIASSAAVNNIGSNFTSNIIGTGFSYNNISTAFNANNIGNNFLRNTIGSSFSTNVIKNSFQYNNILEGGIFGVDFSSATYVYATTYNKTLFKENGGTYKLSYFAGTTLTVVNANA